MGTAEDKLTRVLLTRFKQAEYDLINNRFKKTRFRKLSEYVRSVLLNKPVTVFYRDKSMDDLLEEMVNLRQELNAIGNNLNQAMRSINATHGHADARLWMNLLNVVNGKLEPAILQIRDRMNNYAEVWSQKLKAVKA
ncbi:plasmid mobilization protein [Mucilaginibacter aquatilis]|uniref:Mobilization protein n=1 Tax=Mucilaginibacter aquatilis TaxID=1517760 RepID=A0A6I4ID68_9SPHI|nr:mobilization protein [Mucilaginibacter aquatilis]MVN91536.1 mobilization protein [Mucilaginibacter aquatilis]